MKAIMTLIWGAVLMTQTGNPIEIQGTWEGSLSVEGTQLRLVVHIENEEGNLSATLDSPDQGATGFKVDSITLKDDKLNFQINQFAASYEGTLKDGKFEGEWSQGGQILELKLAKRKKEGKS